MFHEREWEKADEYQDSWKIWLRNYCHREDIIFIDPSSQFKKYYREDKKIYEDHFTDYGHYVFSISFTDWFK